jgi:predicted DNA-binding protein (UPF0251 family)
MAAMNVSTSGIVILFTGSTPYTRLLPVYLNSQVCATTYGVTYRNEEIVKCRFINGVKIGELAKRYDVSKRTIHRILRRRYR